MLLQFLESVITSKSGYLLLAVGNGYRWWEEWFEYPAQIEEYEARAEDLSKTYNVYFSAHLFDERRSVKESVSETRTIQADLDEADLAQIPIKPSVLVRTSPGRHQAYWILNQSVPGDVLEVLSKKLSYSIPNCDRSGWTLGHRMRVPGTFNHKYMIPNQIDIAHYENKTYDVLEFEFLPEVETALTVEFDEDFLDNPPFLDINPLELLESIKDKIPSKVYLSYQVQSKDRSEALWALMCGAFRSGLEKESVFHLAYHSSNNKFLDLKYHGTRELAKDVLRAEEVVKSRAIDIRSALVDARRLGGLRAVKQQYMFNLALEHMKSHGEFIRTSNDDVWYIRHDMGRPIPVSPRNHLMMALMDVTYGLNATESEASYVMYSLTAWANSLMPNGTSTSLSYYDENANYMLLHSGKKDVYKIDKNDISRVPNGTYNIVFPWITVGDPFTPDINRPEKDWSEILFKSSLKTLVGLTPEQGEALLKVWFIFLLMRNAAISKPILALVGQAGSGKSTLFRKILALIYGKNKSVGSITNADDFDYATSAEPLVVLDNVDTYDRWLPDRLALSASDSDITKRKLYTDNDIVVIKRRALIGLTAHDPSFNREDVTDRLLLLNLERLPSWESEEEIISNVLSLRSKLWGGIIRDVQKVLATPQPKDAPQTRVKDFARLGSRIATALGCLDDFYTGIGLVVTSQKKFALDSDRLIVEGLGRLCERAKGDWTKARPISDIYQDLCVIEPSFEKRYNNSTFLARRIWNLMDALKESFDIEYEMDKLNTKIWRFRLKVKNG